MSTTNINRLGLPNLGLGVGLRSKHYSHLMQNDPVVDWFEIISENYINNFGYGRHVLERYRCRKAGCNAWRIHVNW